jgi:uncharacterized RmlC-like cupin family protein
MKGYLINEPLRRGGAFTVADATSSSMTYLSSDQVPGVGYNIEFGWVWGMLKLKPGAGPHAHDCDEVVLNIGGDSREPEDLGAELEFNVGGQALKIATTSAIFIPRGVPHGPPNYLSFRKPHVHVAVMIGTGERGETAPAPPASPDIDYEKYLVRKPAYEVIAGTPVRNRQGPSSMTLMNNDLVPGSNIYIEGGWVWGMPDPNPHIFEHVHDYEEIVFHFGADYRRPEDLGAEIDFFVGGEPLRVDRTSIVYVPRGVSHGPLVWKKYTAPHLEMAIMPGAGTLDEADPGGHREKKRRDSDHG